MSISVTRTEIKAYFATGEVPTAAHFGILMDSIPMIYTETSVDLVADTDLTINHGNGVAARLVQVFDSDGNMIDISVTISGTTGIILNSSKAYTGLTVNILC